MKNKLLKHAVAVALLLIGNAAAAQEIAVESFTTDETDQTARVASPRKDQNGKVCAIVKIETPLQDFTFEAGSSGIVGTEQNTGEIWVYLSPGTLRLTIQHRHLGVIRNYPFGEALKEATVYILKLKSGSVKTVIEDNVALQYIEIVCAEEGATVRIDDTEPEPFGEGKFQKLLSYGKHRYTVEAPGYHPESGMAEITAQKSEPVKIALKPKFGKLTVGTQPEGGADVFIDDVKRGTSPVTIDNLPSGQHKIRAVKPQFLPVSQDITMTDGADIPLTLTMKPNFAVITLTAPDGGDIYIDGELKASNRWSGRLPSGQHKVEVRKPSHRASMKSITAIAGENQTIELTAPVPIYGSLDVKSNIRADIVIDGKPQGTTPSIVNNVLIGNRSIVLRAQGYENYLQTVEVTEGKIVEINVTLQKEKKIEPPKVPVNKEPDRSFYEKKARKTPMYEKHELSIYGLGGISSLNYKISGDGTKSVGAGGAGLGYTFNISPSFGMVTGVEAAMYSSKISLDDLSGEYSEGTGLSLFRLSYSLEGYEETQKIWMFSVPVMMQYTLGSGSTKTYFACGVKLGFPISAKAVIKPGTATTAGYYAHEDITYSDNPQLGFVTDATLPDTDSDIELGYSASATVEFGRRFNIGSSTGLCISLFADYGLNDIRKTKDKSLLEYDSNNPSQFIHNSVLNTDLADKVNLISAGVKIKISFGL